MTAAIAILHAAATLALVGLIWFVQVVHYPLFRAVEPDAFPRYAREHVRRTGFVVVPLMLVELAAAVLLVALDATRSAAAWLGFGVLVLIWLSTFAVQVPLHRRLAEGFESAAAAALVRSNWIRTVLWTVRGAIAFELLLAAIGARSD